MPAASAAAPRGTPGPAAGGAVQGSFDELGAPLSEVTFVVVDLETTGGPPAGAGITEVGAVKVRGGEVLGELQTLVDPGAPVPPFIAALTGITDTMLVGAPRLPAVLPAFLEFARGSVLVAHNAPYDVGFLQGACRLLEVEWPAFPVVDTVRLARRVLLRGEVPDFRLSTLAAHLGAPTPPTHRALDDARATVHLLHVLIARVGDLGVHSLDELRTFTSRVSPVLRRKRHLAEPLPDAPGVYVFEDARGEPLYVGTSRSLRRRVRTYFTASEQRSRMAEMVALADRVRPIVCATALEAQVRELRLIAEASPRYNRRSRRPDRQVWLKLTVEPFPRLSVVRHVRPDLGAGAAYAGPYPGPAQAQAAAEALLLAVPLRSCTQRLPARPRGTACALAGMGRCPAPCDGSADAASYGALVDRARAVLAGDPGPAVAAVEERMARLAARQEYEDARAWRDRLAGLVRGVDRAQRLGALGQVGELVAGRPTDAGGWEVHAVRHGRLVGAAEVPAGEDPRPWVDAVLAAAEPVARPHPPATAGLAEEAQLLWRWLDGEGVRLVRASEGLALPAAGAARYLDRLAGARGPAAAGPPGLGSRT